MSPELEAVLEEIRAGYGEAKQHRDHLESTLRVMSAAITSHVAKDEAAFVRIEEHLQRNSDRAAALEEAQAEAARAERAELKQALAEKEKAVAAAKTETKVELAEKGKSAREWVRWIVPLALSALAFVVALFNALHH